MPDKYKIAIYPGSFDPITLGHLDLITKASKMFDIVVIGLLHNADKEKKLLFSTDERVKMIEDVVKDFDNVCVKTFDGLLVDFAKNVGSNIIIRGIRNFSDYEYELNMAYANKIMKGDLETVFLSPSAKYSHVSSTLVKEIASYGGNIEEFLPASVATLVREKYKK